MGWSVKLFSIRGIPLRLHFSFFLVMVWAAYLGLTGGLTGSDASPLANLAFAEVFVMLLFVCVVLHELAHALTAQMFGIQVQDITLWPLGGVARMARFPESPFQEFVITAAGPAMNVLLTLVLGLIWLFSMGRDFGAVLLEAPWSVASQLGQLNGSSLLFLLVINNLALALFNLIPAFPMDGGRLLRALLAAAIPHAAATRVASWVGQGFALIMLIVALLVPDLLILSVVAILVFLGAGEERQLATVYGDLRGLYVRQAMQRLGLRLHPLQTLGQVAEEMIHSGQLLYLVVDRGRLMGIISRGDILAALRKSGPDARVMQHMTRDIVRLQADEPLTVARDRLIGTRAWVGLVVENGEVVGTVSQGDLNRLADLLKVCPGLLPRSGVPSGQERQDRIQQGP